MTGNTVSRQVSAGGMLRVCEEPGCKTITLGGTCVAHDPEEVTDREHPYGRPFARPALAGEPRRARSTVRRPQSRVRECTP